MLFQPPTAKLPGGPRTAAAERESGRDKLPPASQTAARAPVTAAGRPLSRLFSVPAWPAPVAAAACVVLLVGIAFGDWATGTAIRVTPLYFVPIILASLRFHAPGALIVAAASTLLVIWPSPEAALRAGEPWVLATNAITESLGFAF